MSSLQAIDSPKFTEIATSLALMLRQHQDSFENSPKSVIQLGISNTQDNPVYSRYSLVSSIKDMFSKIYFYDTGRDINSTYVGIDICEASYWGGFTNMISFDSLINQTIDSFISVPEVSEIFYSIQSEDVELFVLLNNLAYDSNLMRQLIRIELGIKDMWKGRNVEIHFAPDHNLDRSLYLKDFKIAYKKG